MVPMVSTNAFLHLFIPEFHSTNTDILELVQGTLEQSLDECLHIFVANVTPTEIEMFEILQAPLEKRPDFIPQSEPESELCFDPRALVPSPSLLFFW